MGQIWIISVLASILIIGMTGGAMGDLGDLYGVDRDSNLLRVIDRTDASTISSVPITLEGKTVNGGQGAAIDPTTGTLWAIVKTCSNDDDKCISNVADGGCKFCSRELVTIIPASGDATSIGVLGDKYAGLEFKSDGTLLGLTGDGAKDSTRINELSKTDASVVSFVCDLNTSDISGADDGESFVNANGVFIHFSGHLPQPTTSFPVSNYIIEVIDLDNSCAVTKKIQQDIIDAGDFAEELIATAYCSDIDTIFLGEGHSAPSSLLTMSIDGVGTNLGSSNDDYLLAGLACDDFVPAPLASSGGSQHEPPSFGENQARDGWYHRDAFCLDAECYDITSDYVVPFDLIELETGVHTWSITVYCNKGVQDCTHVGLSVQDYKTDVNSADWLVEIDLPTSTIGDEWALKVYDPPTDELPDGYLGEVTATTQIIEIGNTSLLLASFTIDHIAPMPDGKQFGLHAWDRDRGVTNSYQNHGIMIEDRFAYPTVDTAFDEPLNIPGTCINEDSTYRYSCAFSLKQQHEIERAEKTVADIMKLNTWNN